MITNSLLTLFLLIRKNTFNILKKNLSIWTILWKKSNSLLMFKNLTHQLMQTTAATNALLKASSKTFLSARTPNIHEISCLVSRTLKATDLGLLLNRWTVAIVKRRKCISFFESVTVNDGWCHSLEANKIQVKDCKKYTGYHLDTNIAFSDVPILRCGGRKMRRNSFLSKVRWWLLQKFYFFQSRRGIWILFWKKHNFVVITLSNVYFDTAPLSDHVAQAVT